MDRPSLPAPHPAMLPAGTVVENWRVEVLSGRTIYGTAYRAVPLHAGPVSPVALKLALHAEDPRFASKVQLLSLLTLAGNSAACAGFCFRLAASSIPVASTRRSCSACGS